MSEVVSPVTVAHRPAPRGVKYARDVCGMAASTAGLTWSVLSDDLDGMSDRLECLTV